jgi:ABC-2 type transport system ATP-binding protein
LSANIEDFSRLAMIVARNLSKRFGRFAAVDSVDFEIPRGRVVGFLGPNGAGKTTTIRMIAGFLAPTSGTVEVDGLDVIHASRQVRQRIGYLPESAPSYTEMRVVEFLKFRARLFAIEHSKRGRAIDLALRRCGLEDVRRRTIGHLSKGYRQRVGLAAALLHQPPVLILDEPTVGLDPSQIREVRALIRELAGRHTILLSTHILPEVELTCDRIMMIARGRIRAQGTIDELRSAAAGSNRYIVEMNSPMAGNALREINGVKDVEAGSVDGHWRRMTVTAKRGAPDLREPIAQVLAAQKCSIRELRREAPSIEHLFVQMIADAEAEAAAGEAGRVDSARGAAA